MIYTCRIALEGIEPQIWRRFQFHRDITFHQLHKILQSVLGWKDYHVYEFQIGDTAILLPDPTFPPDGRIELNARRELVRKHVSKVGQAFIYTYDLGDNWQHKITLENIHTEEGNIPAPVCLDGRRNCPKEDSGGIWGHQQVVEALLIPRHPEQKGTVEWLAEEYDPEHFDLDVVNHLLGQNVEKLIPKAFRTVTEDKKPVKLTKAKLGKYLKSLTRDELVSLVRECVGASKEIERFLSVRILGEEAVQSLFIEYRKKVQQEFFPARGHGKLRLQVAKGAIDEFEQLTGNEKYSLELKLFFVEMGVEFTNTYGDIDERFYNSMAALYEEVVWMVNNDDTAEWFEEYEERISAIVENTRGIGWGFHDVLVDSHAQLRWI